MRIINKSLADTEKKYRELTDDLSKLPVSFLYGSKKYCGFGEGFKIISKDENESESTLKCEFVLELDGIINVEILLTYYINHGCVEWTVGFVNASNSDSEVISELKCADIVFEGEKQTLKGILGDHVYSYTPYVHSLEKEGMSFTSVNGRPTHIWFPYFNLEYADGGTLIAIGWGGTWSADFSAVQNGEVHFAACATHELKTYLKPGERIRTAQMTFLPYSGCDEAAAANLWRRWYIDCAMPKKNAAGESLEPFSTVCLANDTGLPNSDGSISERSFTWKPSLEKMLSEGIKPDVRWIDAGWYFDPSGNTVESEWWSTVGSWQLDTIKWQGSSLRESTDYARSKGMVTMLWFEPERVTGVDALIKNHGYKKEWALSDAHGNNITNNIGNADCLEWTTRRITDMLTENGIEIYREDNNSDAAPRWREADALQGENRQGITENKAVQGHYKMWDSIIASCAKNGGATFIDSCASGGGRNDLESMKRSVPFLRSDSDRTTTALRLSMTTSFNKWLPMCGASTVEQSQQLAPDGRRDKYIWRASYNPILNISAQWVQDPNTDFDMLRFGINEWNSVKGFLLKDFYTLTPWNSAETTDNYSSYCYFDSDTDCGVLFAFRQETCKQEELIVGLSMLDENEKYCLRDADSGKEYIAYGAELAKGFTVHCDEPREARLIYITPNK